MGIHSESDKNKINPVGSASAPASVTPQLNPSTSGTAGPAQPLKDIAGISQLAAQVMAGVFFDVHGPSKATAVPTKMEDAPVPNFSDLNKNNSAPSVPSQLARGSTQLAANPDFTLAA